MKKMFVAQEAANVSMSQTACVQRNKLLIHLNLSKNALRMCDSCLMWLKSNYTFNLGIKDRKTFHLLILKAGTEV